MQTWNLNLPERLGSLGTAEVVVRMLVVVGSGVDGVVVDTVEECVEVVVGILLVVDDSVEGSVDSSVVVDDSIEVSVDCSVAVDDSVAVSVEVVVGSSVSVDDVIGVSVEGIVGSSVVVVALTFVFSACWGVLMSASGEIDAVSDFVLFPVCEVTVEDELEDTHDHMSSSRMGTITDQMLFFMVTVKKY